jgi:hypothetical protein
MEQQLGTYRIRERLGVGAWVRYVALVTPGSSAALRSRSFRRNSSSIPSGAESSQHLHDSRRREADGRAYVAMEVIEGEPLN